MAGIGFELKKLYSKEGIFNKIKASGYSTLIILGPSVICIGLLIAFTNLLKISGVSFKDIELFQITIMYSFIFSVIFTSGFSLIITRYISDKIYKKHYDDIKSSLYGVVTITSVMASVISLLFYFRSPLDIYYKLFAIIIFTAVAVMQILTVYITAIKKYKTVFCGFLIGTFIAVILEVIMLNLNIFNYILSSEICFASGITIIICIMIISIDKYFPKEGNKYFEFLIYFKKYYYLFFTNTFYFLGLYIHNFVYWNVSGINRVIEKTFIYSPVYDAAAFYAFLSSIFINVIFVVKFETSFSVKWSEYLYNINNSASYIDIENSKKGMIFTLKNELEYIIMTQFIISILFVIFAHIFKGIFGFTSSMNNILQILILAYYCIAVMFVLITILLYFDDRKGAFYVSIFFCTVNLLITILTLKLGKNFYGFGTFLAGVLSMIVGLYRIRHFINNIDYYIFCKSSAWN